MRRRALPAAARTLSYALLVAIGCYLAILLFLSLRFTESGPAVLYPSYAILTAALLLAEPRHWWIYMLAASVASFFPNRMVSPTVHVLLTEIANYTKAGVAAGGMRRYGRRLQLDTLRSMAAFLAFAVVLGPLAAAFIGAGVAVAVHGAGDYWLVWRGWFLSNALTGLTLLPLIVLAAASVRDRPSVPSAARMLEAAALGIVLLLVAGYALAWPQTGAIGHSARLYGPLPLLLWAAVRFGPAGASASILLITSVTIWGAINGRGPFSALASTENLLDLQLFLIAASVPLMLLSALVEERRNREAILGRSKAALRASYEQVQNLVGRLITAQEDERSVIARELHDDICQQLAAMSIDLSHLRTQLSPAASALHQEIARLQQRAITVTESVRHLSHGLHPGALRYIGLIGALKQHCAEFSSHHAIAVSFSSETDLENVPSPLALCLYRVAQEALRNVAAHAGASHASIVLAQRTGAVEMIITDDGHGFDPANGLRTGGLGLVSLDERVRVVGGTVTIRTNEQRGTELRVHVPVPGMAGMN